MPKKFFKRYLPHYKTVRDHKHLQMFGTMLHDPNLWHLNRKSTSLGFAIGLFMAFVPVPFQMIPATALAIWLRANLVVSVVLVWISNPITIPPIFYFCYKVGIWIIGRESSNVKIEISWQWMVTELGQIWQPFLLGCFVVSTVCSVIGYFGIRGLWRLHVVTEWEKRKERRQKQRH